MQTELKAIADALEAVIGEQMAVARKADELAAAESHLEQAMDALKAAIYDRPEGIGDVLVILLGDACYVLDTDATDCEGLDPSITKARIIEHPAD